MKTAAINWTEFMRDYWKQVTLEDDILSNGGKVIPAGTYDIVQATPECICLGHWDSETQHWIKAGWLMWRTYTEGDDEFLSLYQRGYEDNYEAATLAEIKDLDFSEPAAPKAAAAPKAKKVQLQSATPKVQQGWVGETHGKWKVDETTGICCPKSGKKWQILKVVRTGEEWIVSNGNKTGRLTQNRWDNIEK